MLTYKEMQKRAGHYTSNGEASFRCVFVSNGIGEVIQCVYPKYGAAYWLAPNPCWQDYLFTPIDNKVVLDNGCPKLLS